MQTKQTKAFVSSSTCTPYSTPSFVIAFGMLLTLSGCVDISCPNGWLPTTDLITRCRIEDSQRETLTTGEGEAGIVGLLGTWDNGAPPFGGTIYLPEEDGVIHAYPGSECTDASISEDTTTVRTNEAGEWVMALAPGNYCVWSEESMNSIIFEVTVPDTGWTELLIDTYQF